MSITVREAQRDHTKAVRGRCECEVLEESIYREEKSGHILAYFNTNLLPSQKTPSEVKAK